MQSNVTLASESEVSFRLELLFIEKQKKGYSNAIHDQPPTQLPAMGKVEARMNYLTQFPDQHIETDIWDQLKYLHNQVLALLKISLA